MIIREYQDAEEQAWLRCRMAAFLDCSYYNDVKQKKDGYEHPAISLVAEQDGRMIGFAEAELDSGDLCLTDRGRGAVLWHLGVLPEFRNRGAAQALWLELKEQLQAQEVRFCEVWTQEDVPANRFYQKMGFVLDEARTWLRCYVQGRQCGKLLDQSAAGGIYGPEQLVFDAPLEQKEKWREICCRMDEVRLYRVFF